MSQTIRVPKFIGANNPFSGELRQRVNQYFEEKNKRMTGNLHLYFKAALYTAGFAAVYTWLVFFTPSAWLSIFGCVLLGFLAATIGFNVMHDGSHGSFSKSKFWNEAATFSLNVLGGSAYMWKVKHVVIHHTFTNIEGFDEDIDVKPYMRMNIEQQKKSFHKYQHFYFIFFYSVMYLFWVFYMDYRKYFSKKIGPIPIEPMKWYDHCVFWASKIFNMGLFVVLPIIMVGFQPFIIGALIFFVVTGLFISIVFQLAHTVEHTEFPVPDKDSGKMEDEWCIHQIKTTANFATRNKLAFWLFGGLNFQIEHHLFPKISHVHYPAISKIVKDVCREFNVQYSEYKTVWSAIKSHILYLKYMGKA